MKEVYTRDQAMELLGLQSINAFLHLAKKHPEAFIVLDYGTGKHKRLRYDKAALDKFVKTLEHLKQEKP
jgi:hypothetical protein